MYLGSNPPHIGANYGFPAHNFFQYGSNINGSHIRTANLGSNYQFQRFPNANFGIPLGNQNAQTSVPNDPIAGNASHSVANVVNGANSIYGQSNLNVVNTTSSVANAVSPGAQAFDVSVQAMPPVTVASNMNEFGDVRPAEENDPNVGNKQAQVDDGFRFEKNQGAVSVEQVENHDRGELSVSLINSVSF